MKLNAKLIGASVIATAILAGCTGTTLPGSTTTGTGSAGTVGQPGFSGRMTKNGSAPTGDRYVFLKKYSGTEGSLANGSGVPGTEVKVSSDGSFFIPAPAEAVSGGALFGIAYDVANATYKGDATKASASVLKDEIQWFSTPAYDLSTKTGKTVSVNFDIAWNTEAFTPSNGGAISPTNLEFRLAPRTGATKYEVTVNKGTVVGAGTRAFSETSATPNIKWTGATAGDYVYQAKAHHPNGVAGVTGDSQAASTWLTFKVSGN